MIFLVDEASTDARLPYELLSYFKDMQADLKMHVSDDKLSFNTAEKGLFFLLLLKNKL